MSNTFEQFDASRLGKTFSDEPHDTAEANFSAEASNTEDDNFALAAEAFKAASYIRKNHEVFPDFVEIEDPEDITKKAWQGPDPYEPENPEHRIIVRDAREFGHLPIIGGIEVSEIPYYLRKLFPAEALEGSEYLIDIEATVLWLNEPGNTQASVNMKYSANDMGRPNRILLKAAASDPFLSATLRTNQRFSLVIHGKDSFVYDHQSREFLTHKAFNMLIASEYIEVEDAEGELKRYAVSTIWQKSPARRTYYGVGIYPAGRIVGVGTPYVGPNLNEWAGFEYEKLKGMNTTAEDEAEAEFIETHIFEVLHDGDKKTCEYELDFWADLLQNPHEKPHVAIVRTGELGGSGKDIIADLFHDRIIGPSHATSVQGTDGLTAKFNGHLAKSALCIGDEIAWQGDHGSVDKLKNETGTARRSMERKGMDRVIVPNFTRYILHTNNKTPVSVGPEDRRFLIAEAALTSKKFPDGKDSPAYAAYYKRLAVACRSPSVVIAFVWRLLNRDLSKFNRYYAPHTAAKDELRLESLLAPERWIVDAAMQGGFIDKDGTFIPLKLDSETEVLKDILLKSFLASVPPRGQKRADQTALGMLLGPKKKGNVPELAHSSESTLIGGAQSARCYVFPPLDELRRRVSARCKVSLETLTSQDRLVSAKPEQEAFRDRIYANG